MALTGRTIFPLSVGAFEMVVSAEESSVADIESLVVVCGEGNGCCWVVVMEVEDDVLGDCGRTKPDAYWPCRWHSNASIASGKTDGLDAIMMLEFNVRKGCLGQIGRR